MTLLLQMSDPHFGTEQPPVVQALEKLAGAVRPDVLVLSGDITQRATDAQFAAAAACARQLAIPALLAIPGNHDIPLFALHVRAFDPYRRYRRAFGADLAPVLDLPGCLVIGVKTTRRYRHERGVVSQAQAEQVARRLAQQRGQGPRVVVVHQPVAVTRKEDHRNLLIGREHAVRRWAEAGADLILGGHIHLPFVLPLHEEFSGLPRRLWCVQAGTAVSDRVRAGAPNSVNLIRLGPAPGHCAIERWDYAGPGRGFEAVQCHELALSKRLPQPA